MLRAPSDSEAGGQGVFHYGSSPAFPDSTWGATNYWVDAVFATTPPADTTGPSVTSVTPAADATDVAATTKPKVTFSEPVTASTVNTSTVKLTNDLGAAVSATVAYDAPTRTATLTPAANLAGGRTYTLTVDGGANGVKDTAGNAMAANFVSSFSTPANCPCSVFKSTEVPAGPLMVDSPIEVGMKIRAERGRLDHRAAVLQAGQQQRHARRPSLERERREARRSHVHQRDGQRLADRRAPDAGADRRQHDLRVVVPLEQRPLLIQHRATS